MKKQKVSTVKNRIWELCKKIVRKRDKNRCQRCGKHVEGSQSETSHVVPKSHGNILRYDIQNLKVMCFTCHRWWHANPTESGLWFKERWPDRYTYLESKKNQIVRWRLKDWLEIEKNLKKQLP